MQYRHAFFRFETRTPSHAANSRGKEDFDFFGRRVISLAVLCDDSPTWRPNKFSYGGWCSRTEFRFKPIKLLDYLGREAELEASSNPIASIVLAFLKARETRRDPKQRLEWKWKLVRGLYERGWTAETVRHLFRVIDWMMELPEELQDGFRRRVFQYEQEKNVPYMTSIERLAMKEGLEKGREEGKALMMATAGEKLVAVIKKGMEKQHGDGAKSVLEGIQAVKDFEKLILIAAAVSTNRPLEYIRRLVTPRKRDAKSGHSRD